jgi:hypothetical protein
MHGWEVVDRVDVDEYCATRHTRRIVTSAVNRISPTAKAIRRWSVGRPRFQTASTSTALNQVMLLAPIRNAAAG